MGELPAGDFAPIVGVTKHTLYAWKKKFSELGMAGLEPQPRGSSKKSAHVIELTKRAILLLKETNPDFGCERISALLARDQALAASPATVTKVLKEAGYETVDVPTRPHDPPVRRFERAKPNQLWQTDLFTFVLKRQNRRVYLVAFMDDYSRFIVGYGLHASQSTALVLEVFRAGVATFGPPEEVLTDNGSQYVTWRGKSAFSKECDRQGIKQIVASPHRPQTLGKIERFWGTAWREFLETAVFLDLEDARRRIGQFIDYYNFRRPHQGIDNLVPADRFFGAESEVRKALDARVAANALELARQGVPRKPLYLTGNLNGEPFSIHTEGDRLILTKEGTREEVVFAGAQNRDLGQRIVRAIACHAKGPGGTAELVKVRAEIADVPRAEQDAALHALERARVVVLGRAIDLAALTEEDRASAIRDPNRGLLVYVSGLGLEGSSKATEEPLPRPVCPDGSPAPGAAEQDPLEEAPGSSPLDEALGPPSADTSESEESP